MVKHFYPSRDSLEHILVQIYDTCIFIYNLFNWPQFQVVLEGRHLWDRFLTLYPVESYIHPEWSYNNPGYIVTTTRQRHDSYNGLKTVKPTHWEKRRETKKKIKESVVYYFSKCLIIHGILLYKTCATILGSLSGLSVICKYKYF